MGWLGDKLAGWGSERQRVAAGVPAPTPDVDWRARGNAALGDGDLDAAARCYEQGIAQEPGDPVLRVNLGYVLTEQGDFSAAAQRLTQALALRRPSDDFVHDAYYLLGRARTELGELPAAVLAFEAAAGAKPDFLEPVDDLIRILHRLQRHEEAVEWTREKGRRVDLALARLDEALRLDPGDRDACERKVTLLSDELRLDEAVLAGRAGLRANPGDAELHWLLAICHLLRGEFDEGWAEHEWRQRHPAFQDKVLQPPQPRWTGENLQGRSIFLHGEQGFGDNIQFLRFVPQVAGMARTVVLHVAHGLESLVAPDLPANCTLLPPGAPFPATDFHLPLMSLPAFLGTREQTIPAQVPYLRAQPAAVAAWRERLGPRPVNVGIAWSGNPTHTNDRNRSMDLGTFRSVAVPGCRFFTVQPHVREADRAPLASWEQAEDTGRELTDFAQTAALVEALDLVITVDTSIAHLAGALGKPVWILVPWVPDWRWMLDRSNSPWYPTARLYRQSARGDWFGVLARVRSDLAELAGRA
ncbi:MAG: hypothetical protein JWP22_42 [Ramlibacter sp.]|nr:hypothetical protein [Ramlibacter sp.]